MKLGQIASCRRELEKTEWAAALQRLQDDVPGFEGGAGEIARCLGPRYGAHFASVDASPEALHSFATFIAGWWLQALIFSFEPSVHLGSTNGTVSARATCITCTSPDPRAC